MRAMLLETSPGRLVERDVADPVPDRGQIRIRVEACGACRTDLHILDGELADAKLPLVPGHQVVGIVDALGEGAARFGVGDRVGVPWLGWTCGR